MNVSRFLESVENFLGATSDNTRDTAAREFSSTSGTKISEPAPASNAPYMEGRIDDLISCETERDVDDLEYGAFEVDKGGTILRYNDIEADINGPRVNDCVGLNLFTEIAPCTRRPEFLGRFLDGVKSGHLDAVFQWRFTYKEKATKVWVCMKTEPRTKNTYWIFFKRL
jgi:photoactive yellow protein